MTNNEKLLRCANAAINEVFGLTEPRHTRGPDSCLRLYYVSYEEGGAGQRVVKVFKHKKNAQAYLKTIQNKPKINFRRWPHDCQFIAKEGIEEMYKHYDIEDWSLAEFKAYVDYHKNF